MESENLYKKINSLTDRESLDLSVENAAPIWHAERNKDWVPFLDNDKSQYPEMLIELANNSPIHGAIIQAKIDQTAGGGVTWNATDPNNAKMIEFVKSVNDSEQDLNEVMTMNITDYVLFNSFAILVTWKSDWSEPGSFIHVDLSKLRAAPVGADGVMPGYWYSWDWGKQRSERVFIPCFNTKGAKVNKAAYESALKKGNSEELQRIFLQPTSQILVFKGYWPNSFYYSYPDYVQGIIAAKTDIQSDNYGLASFENGLNTNIMVTMFGLTTPEQKKTEAGKFMRTYTGSTKANKPIITYADKAENAMKVDMIGQKGEDKVYTKVNENVMQKILTAHRVTSPELVGIKLQGSSLFGSGDQFKSAVDFWQESVIKPKQMAITKTYNKLLNLMGLPNVSIIPFSYFDEEETNQTTTTDNTNDFK